MNTTEIYYAQLNVSKFYTVETINNLINKLSYLGQDVYYNNETRSIDIENPRLSGTKSVSTIIRDELKEWVKNLGADEESISIICDNIDFVFNITKIVSDKDTIIKLYLY